MVAAPNPTIQVDDEPEVIWAEPNESRARFDDLVRRTLGISGEEFIIQWDAGAYRHLPDTPANRPLLRLAMLIPFGRPDR